MSRSKRFEVGTLIEYYPGESNYDIGYVNNIMKHPHSTETEYDVCWLLSNSKTCETKYSIALWDSYKIYKVKH